MNFFKKLGDKINEKLGLIDENKTEKIMKERQEMKTVLANNLKKINFTDEEINEVLSILKKMESEVKILKDSLIGTNINNLDTEYIMNEVLNEIRQKEVKAGEDIKAKIAEIRKRKETL